MKAANPPAGGCRGTLAAAGDTATPSPPPPGEGVDSRPTLLDLFCGAGGAAVGYHRAGFDITGIDNRPQPNYPFRFIQADAMTYPLDGFDAIHASPPCQDHSSLKVKHAGHGTGWMLAGTIQRLRATGVPWTVENVPGSEPSIGCYWTVLCGSSFGLDVRRHRLFASSFLLVAPPCNHSWQTPRFRSLDRRREGVLASVVGVHGHINYAGEAEVRNRAMGIDWMTQPELAQAIPPAYTEHIGAQLLEHIPAAA